MIPWNLAKFSSPRFPIGALHGLWLDQQWADLVALLALLASDNNWHDWCWGTANTLRDIPEDARKCLLSNPSFVSWQQLLEEHLYGGIARLPGKRHPVFRRVDLDAFVLSAWRHFETQRTSGTASCKIRPRTEFTIAGTGYTLVTGPDPIRCRRYGNEGCIFVEDKRFEEADTNKALWKEIYKGDRFRVLATPLYGEKLEFGATTPYLTAPFETGCHFDLHLFDKALAIHKRLTSALNHLRYFWHDMWSELLQINRQIVLFMETRKPNTVSSFSSSSVPGALFLCPYINGKVISLGDILDSLIHEHCHQKLYFLEALVQLYESDYSGMHPSPWKTQLRSIGGILHGYYVFTILARFWMRVAKSGHVLSTFASRRVTEIQPQLESAYNTLDRYCPFTTEGKEVFYSLDGNGSEL